MSDDVTRTIGGDGEIVVAVRRWTDHGGRRREAIIIRNTADEEGVGFDVSDAESVVDLVRQAARELRGGGTL